MEIDVNVKSTRPALAEYVSWSQESLRESYGVARDALVDTEVQRLIEAGYVVKSDNDIELNAGWERVAQENDDQSARSQM